MLKEILYTFSTASDAVDCCFKLFVAIKVEYPFQCAHIWAFYQRFVYQIPFMRKTVGSKVIDELIVELEKIVITTNT